MGQNETNLGEVRLLGYCKKSEKWGNGKETVMGDDEDGGGGTVDSAWCGGGVWVVGL